MELPRNVQLTPQQLLEAMNKIWKLPGVQINRDEFLTKVLEPHCSAAQLNHALMYSPTAAKVTPELLSTLADKAIKTEVMRASALSGAAGLPGGIVGVASIPADQLQFATHQFRIIQKLAYLYGWPSFSNQHGNLDLEAVSALLLFVGMSLGEKQAADQLTQLRNTLSNQVLAQVPRRLLTSEVTFQIIRVIATRLGYSLTKEGFQRGVGRLLPVVGAVVAGGITYRAFAAQAERVKGFLSETPLASPTGDFVWSSADDVIDGEIVAEEWE